MYHIIKSCQMTFYEMPNYIKISILFIQPHFIRYLMTHTINNMLSFIYLLF